MNNPYCWNRIDTNLIFGRKPLMDELLSQLASVGGNSFGLAGARRMGKTTVLRAVERALTESQDVWRSSGTTLIPIYIDGLSLPRPLEAAHLWKLLLTPIRFALRSDGAESNGIREKIDFQDFVANTKSLMSASETVPRVIVLFDEIEHIFVTQWASGFFANWRALLSNIPDMSIYFGAVFSGARELEILQHDIGSPLMDILEWRNLHSLSREDTADLIRKPCELEVQDSVVDLVYKETGGHPMMVQYLMQKMLNGSSLPSIKEAQSAVTEFESRRRWQLADWWHKYCTDDARLVYASLPSTFDSIAVSKISTEFGTYQTGKAFEVLQHVGIAEVSDDGQTTRRRGTIFSRWQETNGRNVDRISTDNGLSEMLAAHGIELRDKYLSAWAIYSTEMPNYSGAVSEMRDTITLILHKLAPDSAVEGQPGFQYEAGLSKPSRRQRVNYIFGARGKEQGKSVASDDELLETLASQVAVSLTSTYSTASALTHTTATRPLAYRALKQGESILAQLLCARN